MRKRRVIKMKRSGIAAILLIVVLLVGMLATACAPGKKPSEEKVITIGVMSTFSGPGSEWGDYVLNPIQLWVEDMNEAGGITAGGVTYKFRIVTADDKYTASEALTQARRLIYEEKVSVIVGPISTDMAVAFRDMATENKVLVFSHGGGQESSPDYPYSFCGYNVHAMMAAEYSIGRAVFPELKKWSGVGEDYVAQHDQNDMFEFFIEQDKAERVEWLGGAYYEAGSSDYYPLLTKYKELGTEINGNTSLVMEDVFAIARQGAEIDFHPVWMETCYTIAELVRNSSIEEVEAWKFLAIINRGNSDRYPEWTLRYSERFGFEPGYVDPWVAPLYEIMLAYGQAIVANDSVDNTKISQLFQDPNFRTKDSLYKGGCRFLGEEVYGINATLSTDYGGGYVKDGKIIYPYAADTEDVYFERLVPFLKAMGYKYE
ncbi:ABC transporter substrate-binding protein [Chloroflexota bacterium]